MSATIKTIIWSKSQKKSLITALNSPYLINFNPNPFKLFWQIPRKTHQHRSKNPSQVKVHKKNLFWSECTRKKDEDRISSSSVKRKKNLNERRWNNHRKKNLRSKKNCLNQILVFSSFSSLMKKSHWLKSHKNALPQPL